MMKKTLFLLAFLIFSGSCFAQIKWDAKAGLNYSNVISKDRNGKQASTSPIPGIYLGLGMNLPLTNHFTLHPALVYAKRGFHIEHVTHIGLGHNFMARVSYIELPIDLEYSIKLGQGKLLLGAGPYLGYGTGGRWTSSTNVLIGDIVIEGRGEVSFQNDSSYGRDMNTYVYAKPWDYGAHFKIAYTFLDLYSLSFDVQQGIADLQPSWGNFQPESTVKNKSFNISLGYYF